jgi:hypothetical protein
MTLASDPTVSETIKSPIRTGAAASPTLTMTLDDRQKNRTAWQAIIDGTLLEWGLNPSRFIEDGLTPPSRKAISLACQVAGTLRDLDREAPLRAVPSGDGGIVFERSKGALFETIEIDEDGSVIWAVFTNSRLRSRRRWK